MSDPSSSAVAAPPDSGVGVSSHSSSSKSSPRSSTSSPPRRSRSSSSRRLDGGDAGPPTAPRRRASPCSFASATASSLRHGGPGSIAPPPSQSQSQSQSRPPSAGSAATGLPRIAARMRTRKTGVGNDDVDVDGLAGKENATDGPNRHRSRADGAPPPPPPTTTTPTKFESTVDEGATTTTTSPPAILSPTPYWKVLEARGDGTRASPRKTRSATKRRATSAAPPPADGEEFLAGEEGELEDEDEDDDNDDNDDGTASLLLHFSTPPDRRMQIQSARNAKRRRDAEHERERLRMEKMRRRGESSMSRGLGGLGGATAGIGLRTSKRARKDADRATAGGEDDYADYGPAPSSKAGAFSAAATTTTTTTGPSEEDLRRIVQESLAGHESSRVEGFVARIATLERDAAHWSEMYEVAQAKYEALKERVEVKERSEEELRLVCAEQRGTIEGYEREVRRLEVERNGADGRHEAEREAFDRERREMEAELAKVREAHAADLKLSMDKEASGSHDPYAERYDAVRAELASARSEIDEANRRNENIEAENGAAHDGLMRRIAELERAESELTSLLEAKKHDNDANQATIVVLQTNVSGHVATITRQEGSISRLEEEVRFIKKSLDDANHKLEGTQSPRSRDASEQEFKKEMGELEGKLVAMEGERVDLQNKMREKDEAYQAVKSELDATNSRLIDTSGAIEEAKVKAANMKVKVQHLSEEVRTAHAKRKENEGMLEEMAKENEQLLARLEATESEMNLRLQEAKSLAEGEARELATEYAIAAAEKDALVEELRLARAEIANLQARVVKLDEEFATSEKRVTLSDSKLKELSSQLQTLTSHLESTRSTITTLEAKLRTKDEYCEQFESIERRLIEEKHVLNQIRANLHNRVIQLSGNIRVFVRVRPFVESERRLTSEVQQPGKYNWSVGGSSSRPSSRGSMGPTSGRPPSREYGEEANDECCPFHFPSITDRNTRPSSSSTGGISAKSSTNYTSFNDLTKQVIELTEPFKDRGGLKERRKKWKYGFDRVFSQDNGQDDVWEGAEPLVQSCIDGFHVCMFAYGQTGSGKTHTMIGVAGDRGLIPRAVTKLFEAKREIERSGQELVNISVEMLEIYNEEVRDLLEYNAGPDGQLIKLKLSSNEAVGNVKVNAQDEREVDDILKLAQERRCVKATKVNAESSRSHLLFTIHFNGSSTDDASSIRRSGCLHIVDLAGSERLDKSGSHGALLTEAKHINTSLSALALVIEKLQAKKKSDSEHIPYRDSKLTYLLRNSLGGDSKTLAIVCCSPHQAHFNESLNSIRFAAKASKVELKEANTVDV